MTHGLFTDFSKKKTNKIIVAGVIGHVIKTRIRSEIGHGLCTIESEQKVVDVTHINFPSTLKNNSTGST